MTSEPEEENEEPKPVVVKAKPAEIFPRSS